jgi:hypothetical protein
MKKYLFLIATLFLCQSTLFAQEQTMSAAAQKYMDRAEMAKEMVKKPADLQKVIIELEKALTEAPNHPAIIYELGVSYDEMGVLGASSYKKAIEYYKQFLALNPNEEDRKKVVSRINKAEYAIEEAEALFKPYLGKWRWYYHGAIGYDGFQARRDIRFFKDGNALKVEYISEYNFETHLTYNNGEKDRYVPTKYATAEVLMYDDGTLEFTTTQICRGVVVENGAEERFEKNTCVYRLKLNNSRLVGSKTFEYSNAIRQTWFRNSRPKNPIKHLTLEKAMKAGDADSDRVLEGAVWDECFVR